MVVDSRDLWPSRVFMVIRSTPVFVEVCSKSMPKGMACDAFGPSEFHFMFFDMSGEIKGINGF